MHSSNKHYYVLTDDLSQGFTHKSLSHALLKCNITAPVKPNTSVSWKNWVSFMLADFEESEQVLVSKRMKYFKDYETCKTAWKNDKYLQDMTSEMAGGKTH